MQTNQAIQEIRMGRKPIITPEVCQNLTKILELGHSITLACQYAQISRDSYYKYVKKDQEFSDKMERAKNYLLIEASSVIAKQIIKNKNVKIAQWYLEKKLPDDFGIKKEIPEEEKKKIIFQFTRGE